MKCQDCNKAATKVGFYGSGGQITHRIGVCNDHVLPPEHKSYPHLGCMDAKFAEEIPAGDNTYSVENGFVYINRSNERTDI